MRKLFRKKNERKIFLKGKRSKEQVHYVGKKNEFIKEI